MHISLLSIIFAYKQLITRDKKKLKFKDMKRYNKEVFVEKYFGLNESTKEDDIIKTDFGQLVNLITMYEEEFSSNFKWFPLETNEDYGKLPRNTNFRCLFDDGTECNYYDKHPESFMTHWKPLVFIN